MPYRHCANMKKFIFLSLLSIFTSTFCLAQNGEESFYKVITVKGRYGFVNAKGEIAIEPQFDHASEFHDGLAKATIGGTKMANYDAYIFGKEGYIDKNGKFVIEAGKYSSVNDFSEGLAGVAVNDCKNEGCKGFIDTTGKIVIEPQFRTVGEFKDGLAEVRMADDNWGVIDRTGKFIVPPIYDGIFPMREGIGIAMVIKNKKPGSLDQKISDFESVLFDRTGKTIARVPFFVLGGFSEGLALIRGEQGMGFIDKTGKVVIEPKFESGFDFGGGLAPVRINGKWGFIDKAGKFIIEPQYRKAYAFSEGLAKVELDGKSGFIDSAGKTVIELQSWYVGSFKNGEAFVDQGDYRGYIDKTGQFIWKRLRNQ